MAFKVYEEMFKLTSDVRDENQYVNNHHLLQSQWQKLRKDVISKCRQRRGKTFFFYTANESAELRVILESILIVHNKIKSISYSIVCGRREVKEA